MNYHKPVLLQSVLHYLDVKPGRLYVDATVGGCGHTVEIIRGGGKVLGLDQDPDALAACPRLDDLTLVRTNFTHLSEIISQKQWQPVSGILFDLGVSSFQLDEASKGFSFQKEGPLDMRMDPTLANTAATLINNLNSRDLALIFKKYGQEPQAYTLAQKIVSARPIYTTAQLAKILGKSPQIHRRVFQSLRIAVNDELGAIETALPQALASLDRTGRLVVISFHSLEDRLVKHTFQNWQKTGLGQILTPKPVVPDIAEITSNSRAKSAKLRAFHKL